MNAMFDLAQEENEAVKKYWDVRDFPDMQERISWVMEGIDTALEIIVACKQAYGVTMAELQSHDRKQPLASIRQEIMAEIHRSSDMTLSDIGRLFNRDHTTVLHAIKVSDKRAAARGQ